jgi:hypothetical protein
MEISGPLQQLLAAIEAAEERNRLAHKDVRETKLQLGALMDERTRLLAAGLKPTHRQFALLLREEGVAREELELSRTEEAAAELELARAKAALDRWLRG